MHSNATELRVLDLHGRRRAVTDERRGIRDSLCSRPGPCRRWSASSGQAVTSKGAAVPERFQRCRGPHRGWCSAVARQLRVAASGASLFAAADLAAPVLFDASTLSSSTPCTKHAARSRLCRLHRWAGRHEQESRPGNRSSPARASEPPRAARAGPVPASAASRSSSLLRSTEVGRRIPVIDITGMMVDASVWALASHVLVKPIESDAMMHADRGCREESMDSSGRFQLQPFAAP